MKDVISCSIGLIQSEDSKLLYIERIKNPYQGQFEFPGGKIRNSETPKSAIIRELKEELDIKVTKTRFIGNIYHNYPEFKVTLYVFSIDNYEGEIKSINRGLCYRSLYELKNGFNAIQSCMKVLKLNLLLPKIKILECNQVLLNNADLPKIDNDDISSQMIRLRNLKASENIQPDILNRFIKNNPHNYIIDYPCEKFFHERFVGIHFKSKYLSTLKSIPKDTTLYSASCHNLEEVEHANRLELDYILISPVLLAKHIHQQTLGWDGFRKLSEKANMPTYALGGICSNDHDYALSLKYGGFGIAGIKKF